MRRKFVSALYAAALALVATVPASAARLYLPVVAGADGTLRGAEVIVSNYGAEGRSYSASLQSRDGGMANAVAAAWTDLVPADKAVHFTPNAAGLLKLDLADNLQVDGWLATELRDGTHQYTRLPLISQYTQYKAGEMAHFAGLERDGGSRVSGVAVVNLSASAARCAVTAFRQDGSSFGAAELSVAAESLASIADSLASSGETQIENARMEVSCNAPFFAYATIHRGVGEPVSVIAPARTAGAPALTSCAPAANQLYCYQAEGLFHAPNRGNEKMILRLPVVAAVNARAVQVMFDVTVGPWNTRNRSGAHGLLWMHRGKFRSNTLGNINALGPNKNQVKFNQNIGLPKGSVTNASTGFAFQQGHTYRIYYGYLPTENKTARLEVWENGVLLKKIEAKTTSGAFFIDIPKTGLIAEFGHNRGQHPPEVELPQGWLLSNFRLVMTKQ